MRTQPVSGDSHVDLDERRFREEVHRGTPPRGARLLNAILPNGRVVWLRVATPLATAASVNHLAQLAENAAEWRQSARHAQHDAIDRLARTVEADAERLNEARRERAGALRRRIVARYDKLDRRLAREAAQFRSRVERQMEIERATARRLQRRDLWDKIVIATSLPLFAAYGQQGRPFGANNVTLTLSLLIWLVGDEIVEVLFGSEEASPYPLRDTDAWSYVAPIGNLLAGWWLLSGLQHERFIAGVTLVKLEGTAPAVPGPGNLVQYTASVDLAGQVAPEHRVDFQAFTGVRTVATIRSIRLSAPGAATNTQIRGLSTSVDGGTLTLSFNAVADAPLGPAPLLGEIDVAWIVDTADPSTTA